MAAPPRPENHDNNSVQAQYGGIKLQAKGVTLILVIGILLNAGVTIWVTRVLRQDFYSAHSQRAVEHQQIVNELARAACLGALTPEERTQFRAGRAGWSRWCWWVSDEPVGGRAPRGDHDEDPRR